MNTRVVIGIVAVGIVGVALAAALLYASTPASISNVDDPSAVTSKSSAGAEPGTPSPGDSAPSRPVIEPLTPPSDAALGSDSRPTTATLQPIDAKSLAELNPVYEEALEVFLDVNPDADGMDPDEAQMRIQGEITAAAATIETAVDAHLRYADSVGRSEKGVVVERAASLHEHMASVISGAPVIKGLPPEEQELQRKVLARMASAHSRKAAALRADASGN